MTKKPHRVEIDGVVYVPLSKKVKAAVGKGKPASLDAVNQLTLALHLYPNYRLDSRGPYGCILDAIKILCPAAYDLLSEGWDVRDVRKALGWDEEE